MITIKIGSKKLIILFTYLFFLNLSINVLIKGVAPNKAIINILEPILIVVILVVVTSYLIDNSYNPFLYFRF